MLTPVGITGKVCQASGAKVEVIAGVGDEVGSNVGTGDGVRDGVRDGVTDSTLCVRAMPMASCV